MFASKEDVEYAFVCILSKSHAHHTRQIIISVLRETNRAKYVQAELYTKLAHERAFCVYTV